MAVINTNEIILLLVTSLLILLDILIMPMSQFLLTAIHTVNNKVSPTWAIQLKQLFIQLLLSDLPGYLLINALVLSLTIAAVKIKNN